MWDLNYAKNLSTCKVEGTYIIPFVATFDDYTNNSVLFVYNFSDPLNPNMIYTLDNNHIIDPDFKFHPIQVAILAISPENITIVVLNLNYGILYYELKHGILNETWPRVYIEQHKEFNSMVLVSNNYFHYKIGAPLIIIIGTIKGLIVIDFYAHSIMFIIPGISSIESSVSVLNAVFIENICFAYLESNELMIILDRGIEKDYISIIKLEDKIQGYNPNAKWTMTYYNETYIYIRSDPDGIKMYNITISPPIFTINKNHTNEVHYIKAENNINESCINNLTIININNSYDIVLCQEKNCDINGQAFIKVIFEGLQVNYKFNPYDYFSGWNMEFKPSFDDHFDIYNLSVSEYIKLYHYNTFELKNSFIQVLPTNQYVVMQSNEGISFFKDDFETLIRNVTIEDIISLEVYNNLVYVLYSQPIHYISVNSLKETYNLYLPSQCNMISFCGDFLICGGLNFVSFYNCSNFNCSFITTMFNNTNITSIASTKSILKNYCNIYILIDYTNLYVVSLLDEIDKNPMPYILSYYSISPALQIYATSLRIYTFYNEIMTIYSSTMVNETSFSLTSNITRVFLLENFVYISTSNELLIIDGLEIYYNMLYLKYQMPNNCTFSSAWFSENLTFIGLICKNGTEYYLKTYQSPCPQPGSYKACQIQFYLKFYIEHPEYIENATNYYNVTFNAQNGGNITSLYVNFEFLIFGQVTHYKEPSNENESITTFYDDGLDLTNILSGFSGNNLAYNLDIDGQEIIPEQSANDPLQILPNVFMISEYTSTINIFSITSIPNTPYAIIYNELAQIIILNTLIHDVGTNQMSTVKTINTKGFDQNLICPGLQYVSTKNEDILLVAACVWELNFLYYWRSMPKLYEEARNYTIAIFQINLKTFNLTWYEAFQIPFKPLKFKPITDYNTKFTVLLLDYHIDYGGDSTFKNNRLYRIEFTWNNNNIIENTDNELIDMYTLKMSTFYVYSMDGYYYNNSFYIVLAEKLNGLLILDYNGSQTKIISSNPSRNDPIYTVGVSYKLIYTVAKSGILTAYKIANHSIPIFSYNRYPFAQTSTISTISSFVTINDYYWPQFLIYLVIYDNEEFYLRLVNLEGTALSFLITDIPFSINATTFEGFYEMSVTFINQTSFAFIYSSNNIKYYYINDYKLIVPKMTKSEYNMMKNKWNKTNFYFKVIGGNENFLMTTKNYELTIMEHNKKSTDASSFPVWLFPVMSIGVLLILAMSVKLVYKFIFSRRRIGVTLIELERINLENH
ncbi:hypothetical protein SteCoe_37846 [Stentor coeruleus]|uniref:Uncharacterized protein n=1 Tax=Stentor coeruleus TaxID=5963 RepID=A0A1R2AMB5_9CILI|nr:hypothetical protein SteCoe_37846 [Stentor coeruleus]